jgi:hypothetical protein
MEILESDGGWRRTTMKLNPNNIGEFCRKYNACVEGWVWALEHCADMQEVWNHPDLDPEWGVWIATRPGVLSDQDARLFERWCAQQVWPLFTEPHSIWSAQWKYLKTMHG